MEESAMDARALRRETGSFTVTLESLTLRPGGSSGGAGRSLWLSVEVLSEHQQPLERLWFAADNENAKTQSVRAGDSASVAPLEYEQSSRPVALSHASLQELAAASLVMSLCDGETRTREKDALVGVAAVAMDGALLAGQMQQTVTIQDGDSSFLVDLSVRSDADLADFLIGARTISVHSAAVGNLPPEWTVQGCESADDAERLCAAPESNAAVYDLSVQFPRCLGDLDSETSTTIQLQGGKLLYERRTDTVSEEQQGDCTPSLTGTWAVRFPDTAMTPMLFLKDAVRRLEDFLAVEKRVRCKLSRVNLESSVTKATDGLTCEFELDLSQLLQPGATQILPRECPLPLQPVDRSVIEQEMASSASNDDKKKLQAVLNDFDAVVAGQAVAVSESVRRSGTYVKVAVDVANAPLVLTPPQVINTPSKSLEELIAPRDAEEEIDQRHSAMDDLRREIRGVVVKLLREYENTFRGPEETESTRNDKRQALVFRLNSQGVYHSFKDALKKRIISVIRDRFSSLDAEEDGDNQSTGSPDDEGSAGSTQERLKERFGQLYAVLMGEVHAVLHDAFYADSGAVEKAGDALEGRPTHAEIAGVLDSLLHKAMENEATSDLDKSETLHLDRVAYAEHHLAASNGSQALVELVKAVWLDYACFCMRVGKLDRAGANLTQCLSLGARYLSALVALTALQCELGAFAQVESLAASCVGEAVGSCSNGSAWESLVLSHALLAYCYSQSGKDATGNLAQFELVKAQQVLQRFGGDRYAPQHVCASAVWLVLAQFAHKHSLHGVVRASLQLADASLKPRESLSAEQRVMRRVLTASLSTLDGDSTGEGVEKELQDALEIDATHPLAWFALGKARLRRDGMAAPAAIECLQRAMEHRERLRVADRLALCLHLGLALLHSSQFAAAEAVFLASCDEFRNASSWLGVGIACLRMERWDSAQLALAMANRLDSTHPDVWGYLALHALTAHARVSSSDELDAGRFVAQAMRNNLSNPVLLRELSNGFVAVDRLEQAERLLRRSLACQDSSLTRKTLADVLAAQNCAEDALRQYAQSLSAAESVAERCELLDKSAQLLVTLGRPEEASDYRAMASAFQAQQAL